MALTLTERTTENAFGSGVIIIDAQGKRTTRWIGVKGTAPDGRTPYRYCGKPSPGDNLIPRYGDPHPAYPEMSVSAIQVHGDHTVVADNGSGPDFEAALLEVSYTTFLCGVDGIPVWSIEPRPFSIAIPGLQFADGTPLPDGQSYRTMDYQALLGNRIVTMYPGAGIEDCRNKVNASPWGPAGLGYEYAPGTVLYCTPKANQKFDVNFGLVWMVQHQLLVNGDGWNNLINPNSGNLEPVFDAWGNPYFGFVDFAMHGLGI